MYYTNYIRYIKKEDAPIYILQHYRLIGIIYIAITVMLIALTAYLLPQVTKQYISLAAEPHVLLQLLPYGLAILSAIALGIAVFFLTKSVNEKQLQEKLKMYQEKEMVSADKVLDMRNAYYALAYAAFFLIYVSASLILPILNLPQLI